MTPTEAAARVAIQAFNEAMVTGAGKQWVALRQAMDGLNRCVDENAGCTKIHPEGPKDENAGGTPARSDALTEVI